MNKQLEDFCYIVGFSGGSLLYLKSEKRLFTRKNKNPIRGKVYWTCYDPIIKTDNKINPCGARCTFDVKTGECWRNDVLHSVHRNHELIYHDLLSLNAMKDHCRYLAKNFPISAHKIPIKEIFLAEMAK